MAGSFGMGIVFFLLALVGIPLILLGVWLAVVTGNYWIILGFFVGVVIYWLLLAIFASAAVLSGRSNAAGPGRPAYGLSGPAGFLLRRLVTTSPPTRAHAARTTTSPTNAPVRSEPPPVIGSRTVTLKDWVTVSMPSDTETTTGCTPLCSFLGVHISCPPGSRFIPSGPDTSAIVTTVPSSGSVPTSW